MAELGILGVRKAKKPKTTRLDPASSRPIALLVMDLTYVATWAGMAHLCFITDVCSGMIVNGGRQPIMRTDLVLDAVDLAHSEAGSTSRRSATANPSPL